MRALAILLLGFAIRIALILANPIIFGGDTVIRLVDRYTLVRAHQLPLLQTLIAAVSWISPDPDLVRYLMATIGAVAGLGFYCMAGDLFGEKWAFPAALLFVTNPFILAVSTVPFQEILMLAALFFAFHFFYREQWAAASVCLALACLTRYEAWAACPVLAVTYAWRKNRSMAGWMKGAALFCWLPLAWVAAQQGLTLKGHFVVERSVSIWRLQRYVYLGWITVKYTQITVLLLALAGAWRMYKNRALLDWRFGVQIAFVALFELSVPFSAHGVMPDPERYVTSREAHIPICFVVLLAGAGLAQWPKWTRAIVAASVALGVAGAWWYMRVATSEPSIQVAWKLARYLDHNVKDNEHAAVLTKPIPQQTATLYLNKARQTGGEAGLEEAERELSMAAEQPPDFQRVLVYSRLPRSRLRAAASVCDDWTAIWSDAPNGGAVLAGETPVQVLRSGPLFVSVVRRQCPH